ncbi:MAG: ribonucleoside triphosphate reductase, partial [bacterium]|nr:ribonucleoside triphosphate reductase [bacterium]
MAGYRRPRCPINFPPDILNRRYPLSFKEIIKRDGRRMPFKATKITAALENAGTATGEYGAREAKHLTLMVLSIAEQVLENREPGLVPTVEAIQDIVEQVLLQSLYKKTAKAYIIYRDQHTRLRRMLSRANVEMVDQYLEKLDWQVKENSNMAFSLQGLNNYLSSEISKVYWLNKIYPDEIREAHSDGEFHIHDLSLISVYCVGWDLQDLLREGFRGVSGKVESRPPRHFRSALGQMVNFFYTLQGEAAGAQAFSHFDTLLAPFIRFDKLTYIEVKQALQEFVFNINVPTRVGFQTPFTNITMDLTVSPLLKESPVIIGGEMQEDTYAGFQHEMNLINRAFLEVMAEGDARGRVFTFPIPTYNITKDFDWDNPELDLLWQATARYGIPYFSNFINSDMSPEDARSMCCRLRLDTRQLEKRGGGLFGANPLTGSIGVVTLNLPRLGLLATDKKDFLHRLGKLMEMAKNSLEIKRKILERLTDKNLYPYTSFYLRNIKESYGNYWENHFSTIGLVGMNEALANLTGDSISSKTGIATATEIMDFMRERLLVFQEETGNNYNLEATPAEGTAYRLARIDKEKHPEILCANEEEFNEGSEPFYTNSTLLPVNFSEDIIEVLELQDGLQSRYTGGTVLHMFCGEKNLSPDSVKTFV